MTYALIEASPEDGRPFFLYQFAEGMAVWRFTSRAADWVSTGGGGEDLVWEAAAIAHGEIVTTGELERGRLEVTFPLSHPFARRFLAPPAHELTTLTLFRGHEQVPQETVVEWKGRVVGAATEGARILIDAESLFTALRRAGVRAKYQRLCRHALYGRGCNLDRLLHADPATVTAVDGASVLAPAAATRPDGWYRGGVLEHEGTLGFMIGHAGATLQLARPMPELAAAVAAPPSDPVTGESLPVMVDLAPGCDLRAETCHARFGNLLNFGGFPEIPGRNPFGGSSIV